MKWLRTMLLIERGDVVGKAGWHELHDAYRKAIESIDFPSGSGTLTLRKKRRLENSQWARNGVTYLKNRFFKALVDDFGWTAEAACSFSGLKAADVKLFPSLEKHSEPISSRFGGFDFVTETDDGVRVAIEWETGNISSSHRSMNKLALALEHGVVDVAVLIVPSRDLYEHLTDRIGNISELSGYLTMWQSIGRSVENGVLAVTVVEHDALTDDEDFPYLRSGNDGRSAEGAAKLK